MVYNVIFAQMAMPCLFKASMTLCPWARSFLRPVSQGRAVKWQRVKVTKCKRDRKGIREGLLQQLRLNKKKTISITYRVAFNASFITFPEILESEYIRGRRRCVKNGVWGIRGLKGTRKCELFACRSGLFILPDSPERSRLIKLGKYYTAFVLFTRVLSICEFVSNTKDGFTRARMHRTKSNIVCWRLAEICQVFVLFFFSLSLRQLVQ